LKFGPSFCADEGRPGPIREHAASRRNGTDAGPKRGSADEAIWSIVVDVGGRVALADVAQHRRIQVLFWMHRAHRDLVLQKPFRTRQTTGSPNRTGWIE
jgi:hypothetical protein